MKTAHRFARLFLIAILCIQLTACRNGIPATPIGSAAREVVTKYFEALAQQDWDAAYPLLDLFTQKHLGRAALERSARDYQAKLGFPVGKVFVRSCDEDEDKAVAQVILMDANGSMKHRFHEGAVLQRTANGWGVVLPRGFGR